MEATNRPTLGFAYIQDNKDPPSHYVLCALGDATNTLTIYPFLQFVQDTEDSSALYEFYALGDTINTLANYPSHHCVFVIAILKEVIPLDEPAFPTHLLYAGTPHTTISSARIPPSTVIGRKSVVAPIIETRRFYVSSQRSFLPPPFPRYAQCRSLQLPLPPRTW